MKELNTLIEWVEDVLERWPGTKELGSFDPDNILAIAEAFQALEQRAEAAEASAKDWRNKAMNQCAKREVPESKLADLRKQEPAGTVWVDCTTRGTEYEFRPSGNVKNGQELFTRPAPAVSLAELVPEERSYAHYIDSSTFMTIHEALRLATEWNACRAALLRNIEEAK